MLDVGAAVGYHTLLASRAVGAEGGVYAFEADPYAARSLRRNVEINHASNERVYELAAVERSPGRTRDD
jgi:FkbM family methyltransferase